MTSAQITPFEIPRDRFKRPLVIPPGGGKPVAYTRCTTFVGGIEDTYKLGQWQQRHVALGIATNPDLADAVRTSDLDDKGGLNNLCDEAKDRAGASDSARIGTYLHAVTEAADRGQDPMGVPLPELAMPRSKEDFLPDLAAYMAATDGLKSTAIETFGVLDNLKIGGTSDRIVKIGGKKYIADLKTGSVEFGSLKIAAQLAVYARSHLYDWRAAAALGNNASAEQARALRTAPGVEVDKGLVIHLPQGTGTCTLYWVDLLAGWEAVRVCRDIREKRTLRFRDLFSMFAAPVAQVPVTEGESFVSPTVMSLARQITECVSADAVRALWSANASDWTEDLTKVAKGHIASLSQ